MAAGLVIHGLLGFGGCGNYAELFRRQGLKDLCQLLFKQNDQNDIPSEGFARRRSQPRPRPLGGSASKARLTTSLIDTFLTDAYNRTR